MECARRRVSFATWRLSVFRQLLSTSHPSRTSRRSTSSSAESHEPLPSESELESETKPNEDEKRIPPSQRLPQSPLITHPRNEPKKIRKKQPTREDLEPLANNPWAVALASPVRMCAVTGVRLPRALLGEWGLVQGSGSNADRSYMLPVGLLKDSLAGQGAPGQTSTEEDKSPDTETSTQTEKQAESKMSVKPLSDERPGRQLVLRMVERLSHLRKIARPLLARSGGKKPAVARLVPFRWKYPLGPFTSRVEKNMVWMEDTPEFVLRHMRLNVARKLERTSKRYKHLGAADGVWNVLEMQGHSDAALSDALGRLQAVDRAECGAVLLFGPFPEGVSFAETVMLSQTQSTIPVFDMSALLSESDMQTLREAAPHFHNTALMFRPNDQLSVDMMLSLWKLKRFLADDPMLRD